MTSTFAFGHHFKMLQDLRAASSALQSAIDRYLVACSALIIGSGQEYGFASSLDAAQDMFTIFTQELGVIASYEGKIVQARAVITAARNSSLSLVPINSLPDEIILHIFHLILVTGSCAFETETDAGRLPQRSLAISQVCSRWRRIALGSRHLWSHVDLSSDPLSREMLLSRGKAFASLTGDVLLDVHIVEARLKPDIIGYELCNDLNQFFMSVGSCVGSLELDFTLKYFAGYFNDILDSCLENCVPGKLTQLTLKFCPTRGGHSTPESDYFPNDSFLCPGDWERVGDRENAWDWSLNLTSSQLEEILFPVTVLRLDKVFPHWTSEAYYGLVELQLISWELATNSIEISEQQLAGIFQSSPGLKVLHFGLEITSTTVPHPPVQLKDLEELHIRVDNWRSQQTFLRLLIPGPKPMLMFIDYDHPHVEEDRRLPSSTEDELQNFFRRSNVVQLYLDADNLQLHLPAFLQLLPNLEILGLRHLAFDAGNPAFSWPAVSNPDYPKLHTIHFIFGRIELGGFRWICDTNHLKLRRVTIYDSMIGVEGEVMPHPLDQYIDLLQRIFPAIEMPANRDANFQIEDRDKLIRVRNSDY